MMGSGVFFDRPTWADAPDRPTRGTPTRAFEGTPREPRAPSSLCGTRGRRQRGLARSARGSGLGAIAAVVSFLVLSSALPSARAGQATRLRNGRISFTYLDGIRTVEPDGSTLRTYAVKGRDATWSPDGKRLAFIAGGSTRGTVQIWTMHADGSHVEKVTTGTRLLEEQPAWSPDGGLIAFTGRRSNGSDDAEIYTIRPNGGGLRQLTDNTTSDAAPVWAPDGRSIVFTRQKPWIMDRNGAHERSLVRIGWPRQARDLDWSPSGRSIVFAGLIGQRGGLWRFPADGSAEPRFIAAGLSGPSWSPDGRFIVAIGSHYDNVLEESRHIVVVVRPDGSHRRRIFIGDYIFPNLPCCPDWRPVPRR
jgi:hypothetical protein